MKEKPNRFIVVDDDAINNMMCKFSIKRHFQQPHISTFLLPEAALDMIADTYTHSVECIPTMLFLDIDMPSLTAWDFLERFAHFNTSVHEQILIYILSSSIDPCDREKANAHPLVSGYLSKPLTTTAMDRLFRAIDQTGI